MFIVPSSLVKKNIHGVVLVLDAGGPRTEVVTFVFVKDVPRV